MVTRFKCPRGKKPTGLGRCVPVKSFGRIDRKERRIGLTSLMIFAIFFVAFLFYSFIIRGLSVDEFDNLTSFLIVLGGMVGSFILALFLE